VPLPEDLVLDHLDLGLTVAILAQLDVLTNVFQENLLYLSTLVVTHHLRYLLGRGGLVLDDYMLF